jgi:hypothetical protein
MKHSKSKGGEAITIIAKIHEKLELEVSPFWISWSFILLWQVKGFLLFLSFLIDDGLAPISKFWALEGLWDLKLDSGAEGYTITQDVIPYYKKKKTCFL